VRAGEGGGFDKGMLHEPGTDGRARIEKEGKNAFRQVVFFDGRLYGAANELAGPGMRRMGLYNDGISRGECGGGVATGDRKREREIAGAKDDDGANGAKDGANVGLAGGFAIGIGAIDARRSPGAVFDDTCEKAQLTASTREFALETRNRQRGFEMCARDERIGDRFDVGRD